MAKKLAFVEYAFILDADTFDNTYDFEKLLSSVFKAKGYEGVILDNVRGASGRRIILVRKIESAFDKQMPPVKDFKSSKKVNL